MEFLRDLERSFASFFFIVFRNASDQ